MPLETQKLDEPARLKLAQEAFHEYQAQCFWWVREDFQVTPDALPMIIKGLRSHGDRRAFFIAAELCR
jgi:hypothetical protein